VALVGELRAAGVSAELAGEQAQPFFSVRKATLVLINQLRPPLQVFEYATSAAADSDAVTLHAQWQRFGVLVAGSMAEI
jgi:hypothetical protein